jgi:chromatin segregation and condensation protein Rec8/ScpA/Scc1 (kleisin family)
MLYEEEGEVAASDATEDADLYTADESDEDSSDDSTESVEDYKARLEDERKAREKAEELAKNYKIRAEKAERKSVVKPAEPTPQPQPKSDLSAMDTIALINAQVTNKEDIEEVLDYAKHKNISINEALQTSVVKSILADIAEKRNIAQATNVTNTKRGTGKISDDTLLAKAEKDEMPESEDEIARLWKARKGLK